MAERDQAHTIIPTRYLKHNHTASVRSSEGFKYHAQTGESKAVNRIQCSGGIGDSRSVNGTAPQETKRVRKYVCTRDTSAHQHTRREIVCAGGMTCSASQAGNTLLSCLVLGKGCTSCDVRTLPPIYKVSAVDT